MATSSKATDESKPTNPVSVNAGWKTCCGIHNGAGKAKGDALGNEETQKKMITEKAFDSTVKRIKSSLSWASAGLLGTCTSGTISVSFGDAQWESVLASWVYVILLFAITVFLQTCSLDAVDTPDSIGKELDTTVPPKKAKRGDKIAKYELEKQVKKQKASKTDRSSKGVARRIYQFAERSTDAFFDNLASLATAIFANVVAIALNSAVVQTFAWIIENENLTVALFWVFALLISMIAGYVAIKTGKELDDLEIDIYDCVYKAAEGQHFTSSDQVWTNAEIYDDVVRFATKKRSIGLANYSLGLSMAWAWRDALRFSILNAYEGESDSLSGMWIYVLSATLIVTFVNALSEKYYFLYPRDVTSSFQLETQERGIIGKSIYRNLQTVVGIAWFDAVVGSCAVWFNNWDTVGALWGAYFLFLTGSLLGEYYWQALWLRFEMFERGVVTAIYNGFNHLWDRDRVLEIDEEEKENANWSYEFPVLFAKEGIELTVFAWGVGAGWTASSAVKAVLTEIYDGTFDPDTTEDITGDVLWSAWVAWILTLVVSTLIMWALSNLQKKRKEERKAELKKVADAADDDEDEKKVNDVQLSVNKEQGTDKQTAMKTVLSDSAHGTDDDHNEDKDGNANDDDDNNDKEKEKEKERTHHE